MSHSFYVAQPGKGICTCLAADTKPTCPDGLILIEEDTGKVFRRESGGWVEKLNDSYTGGPGASVSASRVVVSSGFPAKRNQRVNIVDAAVVVNSRVNAWVSGIADGLANAGDLVDVHSMRAVANAGSFDLDMDFLTPWAGSLSIDYVVFE